MEIPVLDSPRKWRAAHPSYWKDYRRSHPQAVERNRQRQQLRDQGTSWCILQTTIH